MEPKRTEQGLALEGECKFCGADLALTGGDCENGSVYDDEGNHVDVTYCGNLCCNACGGQCQGNPATDELRALAALNRAIKEQRSFGLIADRSMHGRVP